MPPGMTHLALLVAARVIVAQFQELIELLIKWTDPSAKAQLTPPGWKLIDVIGGMLLPLSHLSGLAQFPVVY